MFRDVSIRRRLVAGFGSIVALLVLVVLMTLSQFTKTHESMEAISGEFSPQVKAADALAVALHQQSTSLRGYVLSGDEKLYSNHKLALADQDSSFRSLQSVLTDPEDREKLTEIQTELLQIRQEEERLLNRARSGDRNTALRLYQNEVRPCIAAAVHLADQIALAAHNHLDEAADKYYAAAVRLRFVAWSSLIAALLFSGAVLTATIRSISHPAKSIAQAANAMTRGDYPAAKAMEKSYGRRDCSGELPRNELRQIAVSLAEMAKVLERRERSLRAHSDLGAACASSIKVDHLLDDVLSRLAQHTNSQVGALYINDNGVLSVRGTYGMSAEVAKDALTGPEGFVEQVTKTGKRIVLSDIPPDSRFVIDPGLGRAMPRSMVSLPLIAGASSIGAVVLASLHSYDNDSLAFLESATAQIAVALSNAMHHEDIEKLALELKDRNEKLDVQNEQLQCQNEEIQAQTEEIQTQNEELAAQSTELQERYAELESVTRDLLALQSVTATALSSLQQDQLLSRLMESIVDSLNLTFGLVMLMQEDQQTLRAKVGHNIAIDTNLALEVRIGEGFPGRVAESRQIMTATESDVELLLLDSHIHRSGARALVGLPLITGGRLHGVALLGSSEPREFSERQKHLLQVFATRSAVAIERAQAYERLQAAEKCADRERRHLQSIIDNMPEAVVLASAPDGRVVIANKVALSLYGLDSLPDTEVADHAKSFNFYRSDGSPILSEELPVSKSLLKGEVCTGEELLIRRPDHSEIVVLCNTCPVRDESGEITGAVGVFQDITALKEQQRLLQEVYEHERYIAQTLQRSFLPTQRPIVAGYDIADTYIPAQTGAQVGGDFYDLIDFGNDKLGIVMADVSGKGVGAAIHTAMAKYMLRGFASEDPEPASVLARTNSVIANCTDSEVFITLFYGVLDTKERKLTYANAGHERPLLFNKNLGSCCALQTTGPALGILPDAAYVQLEVDLAETDAFVLYTDGITEARREGAFLGQDRLEAMISQVGESSADAIADHILSNVQDYSFGDLRDDVALVVIKPGDYGYSPVSNTR